MLDAQGNIKLIDFGLAGPLTPRSFPSDTGMLLATACGSERYAAPEVINGEAYDGKLADIWSIGIVLYAMLCGSLPFDHPNPAQLYHLINEGTYMVPEWVSSASERVIGACLRHTPEQRISLNSLLKATWLNPGKTSAQIAEALLEEEQEEREYEVCRNSRLCSNFCLLLVCFL